MKTVLSVVVIVSLSLCLGCGPAQKKQPGIASPWELIPSDVSSIGFADLDGIEELKLSNPADKFEEMMAPVNRTGIDVENIQAVYLGEDRGDPERPELTIILVGKEAFSPGQIFRDLRESQPSLTIENISGRPVFRFEEEIQGVDLSIDLHVLDPKLLIVCTSARIGPVLAKYDKGGESALDNPELHKQIGRHKEHVFWFYSHYPFDMALSFLDNFLAAYFLNPYEEEISELESAFWYEGNEEVRIQLVMILENKEVSLRIAGEFEANLKGFQKRIEAQVEPWLADAKKAVQADSFVTDFLASMVRTFDPRARSESNTVVIDMRIPLTFGRMTEISRKHEEEKAARALKELCDALEAEDSRTRIAAAKKLFDRNAKVDEAVSVLQEILKGEDQRARLLATRALLERYDSQFWEMFVRSFRDEGKRSEEELAQAVKIRELLPMPSLILALRKGDEKIQEIAVRAIEKIGDLNIEAVPLLRDYELKWEGQEEGGAVWARAALRNMRLQGAKEPIEDVIAWLGHEEWAVKELAAKVLWWRPDDAVEFLPLLTEALKKETRREAREKLAEAVNRVEESKDFLDMKLRRGKYTPKPRFFKRHVNPDGSWSFADYRKQCEQEAPCKHLEKFPISKFDQADNGATALVLLCHLGAGHTHKSGKFRADVAKGLVYLEKQQDEDGSFSSNNMIHALSALAIAEAHGMTRDGKLKAMGQKAINVILQRQNPNGGWDYEIASKRSDTLVTGWHILALASGRASQLNVGEGLNKAGAFFDAIGPKIEEAPGPEVPGLCADALGEDGQPSEKRSAMSTAISLMCRIAIDPRKDPEKLKALGKAVLRNLPGDFAEANLHEWYFATLATFQMGGDYWKKWNEPLKTQLCDSQIFGGCADGSWDPTTDPASQEGGRILTTALGCLTLEVYYRYLPVHMLIPGPPRMKKDGKPWQGGDENEAWDQPAKSETTLEDVIKSAEEVMKEAAKAPGE